MVRVSLFFAGIVLLTSCQSKLDQARTAIANELAGVEGVFAVAFHDFETGEEILINEREEFHAASTMKTPVMIEVYKQANLGRFSLADSMVVKNEFKSIVDGSPYSMDLGDDSEQYLYRQVGMKKTIYDLVYEMITVSSNLATNNIIDLVDATNVTETMRTLNAHDIQVLRGVEDGKAYERGLSNTTTAYDLMLIMGAIAQGKAVDASSSEAMTKILLDQQFNEMIPAHLPSSAKVAHKTGNITGVNHDSGFIILPDGRKYVLVLLSKGVKDQEAGIAAMASASRKVYDYVTR
jgi:beta-lactamase class A